MLHTVHNRGSILARGHLFLQFRLLATLAVAYVKAFAMSVVGIFVMYSPSPFFFFNYLYMLEYGTIRNTNRDANFGEEKHKGSLGT